MSARSAPTVRSRRGRRPALRQALEPEAGDPDPGAGASSASLRTPSSYAGRASPAPPNTSSPVASDPLLGSIVFQYSNQDDQNGPPNVAATSAGIASPLAPGSYYWAVQPVDAEGNRGVACRYDLQLGLAIRDRAAGHRPRPLDQAFDPKFSWNPVPGAARYEVEINPSVDFSPGSKVCCTGTTIATSLSPPKVFKNDTYHWRVRRSTRTGRGGLERRPVFKKTFDNVPPRPTPPSRTCTCATTRATPGPTSTRARWATRPGSDRDLEPGARRLGLPGGGRAVRHRREPVQLDGAGEPLGRLDRGERLDAARRGLERPQALRRLAPGRERARQPDPGTYCVRVRARTDRDTNSLDVYGDYTYLDDGTGRGTAFDVDGLPAGRVARLLRLPLLRRLPDAGGPRHKDAHAVLHLEPDTRRPELLRARLEGLELHLDRRLRVHARPGLRAPNIERGPTYTDETTSYYWAVLPAQDFDGNLAKGDPLSAAASDFQKQSAPPSLLSPSAGQVFLDQPTFRWGPAEGARRYRLQVASDTSFSNLLDDVTTDGTSYSSNTTYPADTVLYWRVRADDENLNGLNWSAVGTFQKTLPVPVPSASNPTSGDMLPVWSWAPVQGASSYDVEVDQPDGQHKVFGGLYSPLVSFIKMTGTGIWHWRVRAEFPRTGSGATPGPYSSLHAFTRTISQPVNLQTDSGTDHVLLSWNPRIGVKNYRVEISSTPDFSVSVEDVKTDNTSFAPTMTKVGLQCRRHALVARRGHRPGRHFLNSLICSMNSIGPSFCFVSRGVRLHHRERQSAHTDRVALGRFPASIPSDREPSDSLHGRGYLMSYRAK